MVRRRTGSRVELSEPFQLGDLSIGPGQRGRVSLPVARLPNGTPLALGVHVLHGARPGPTAFVSAAVHGDELNGVSAVHDLLDRLEPPELRGTLLLVPVVNGFGVIQETRYLPDRRDLNRSFPGSARGSLTSRLAHLFFSRVVSRCRFGIDLHTGSGGRCNLPQVRCDLDDPDTRRLAHAFGGALVLHSSLRPGSLRAAARRAGITILLHESGEALRIEHRFVAPAVEGVLRVLRAEGMLRSERRLPMGPQRVARQSRWLRAPGSGVFESNCELGDLVRPGAVVGRVRDPARSAAAELRAPDGGLVIGLQTHALVYKGDALLHIADVSG